MIKNLLRLLVVLLPWPLRRRVLASCFGYEIDPTARIGWAWVFPRRLVMGPGSHIGHLTACVHLDEVVIGAHGHLGRLNWVTGFPGGGEEVHFAHLKGRVSRLAIGAHAAVTNRHLIDCTSAVEIGEFTTVAGFRTQILTHSIDLEKCRQDSAPVVIGPRCFVGTGCILLGGAVLPACSVLGAGAVLNKAQTETHTLYAGQPARAVKALDPQAGYFTRERGFVA
jgi:acetyltransferase-like isoleucine patch superfamily enzyme